jgi:hypothetical protein
MFKKQAQAQPEQIGRIAELQAEVYRLGMALNNDTSSAWNKYAALESEVGQLESASNGPVSSLGADIERETQIAIIRRRMLTIERSPEYAAARPARIRAYAELTAAQDALKEAEFNLTRGQIQLADFDRQTRRICAERDYWRARMVANLAPLTGSPVNYPAPLDYSKIT